MREARRAFDDEGMEGVVRVLRNNLGDEADNVLRELGLEDYIDDTVRAVCSFSGDTLVSTINGLEAISALDEGDWVLAYDEATDTIGYYPILATWVYEDPLIVLLTINGETIETTPEHPFRTADGDWVAAGELQAGDRIQRPDGTYGLVEAVDVVHRLQPMYNLTVAFAHTYFVGDGQWLVHNSCLKQIQEGVNNTVRPYLNDIRRIAPDAQVGFRGSLARGTKGPHKGNVPFDSSNFDVDAFIISDELAKRFPEREWFRSGNAIPELQSIQEQIHKSLTAQYPGYRAGDNFTFRIWTRDEFYRKVRPDERYFINP